MAGPSASRILLRRLSTSLQGPTAEGLGEAANLALTNHLRRSTASNVRHSLPPSTSDAASLPKASLGPVPSSLPTAARGPASSFRPPHLLSEALTASSLADSSSLMSALSPAPSMAGPNSPAIQATNAGVHCPREPLRDGREAGEAKEVREARETTAPTLTMNVPAAQGVTLRTVEAPALPREAPPPPVPKEHPTTIGKSSSGVGSPALPSSSAGAASVSLLQRTNVPLPAATASTSLPPPTNASLPPSTNASLPTPANASLGPPGLPCSAVGLTNAVHRGGPHLGPTTLLNEAPLTLSAAAALPGNCLPPRSPALVPTERGQGHGLGRGVPGTALSPPPNRDESGLPCLDPSTPEMDACQEAAAASLPVRRALAKHRPLFRMSMDYVPAAAAAAGGRSSDRRKLHSMVTASANGRKAFFIDTLALVRRLEAEGLTAKQAEAITHVITDVLHESLESAGHTFVSKNEMQKSELLQEAAMSRLRTELQSGNDVGLAKIQKEVEGLHTDLDKLKSELKYEVDKVTAGQRLDLNLERGRVKEELNVQAQETSNLSNKMDREVNALKAQLEAAKFEVIRYCVGTLVSMSVVGLGLLRVLM